MLNHSIWVVVANGHQAKIFRTKKLPKLEVVETLQHPESRLHNEDLVTDKPGRNFEKMGTTRHAYEDSDPKHTEIEKFSRELSQYLTTAYAKKDFTRLYLIASPSFLGMIRQHLTTALNGAIVSEIPKDMTEQTTLEIEKHLAAF